MIGKKKKVAEKNRYKYIIADKNYEKLENGFI
jgi:hypothetical protein